MRTSIVIGFVGMALVACGGSAPQASNPAAPARTTQAQLSSKPAQTTPTAPGTIRRSSLREVLAAGPGSFLQHISLDDQPVRKEGRFYGFKVAALDGADWWSGVDLAPGDVVTTINGVTIERPEHLRAVFTSLETAKELRVGVEREGKPRELKWAIVDDEPAK